MARLIAKPALADLLPLTIGTVTLSAVETGPVTLVAPFKGQDKAVSAALKAAFGVGFPGVGRQVARDGVRLLWAGKGRALMIGAAAPDLAGLAACTDQTGANAVVRIEGAEAEAVLARLVPLDLRAATFKTGHTARTMLGHMQASVTRTGAQAFEVMAMRSMAATLVHDLEQAAKGLAARAGVVG